MRNSKPEYTENRINLIVIIVTLFIMIMAFFIIPHLADINTKKTIMNQVIELEKLLDTYLTDNNGLSEGLLAEVDMEAKVKENKVYSAEGIVKEVNLNQNYYRIPGIINVIMDNKAEGRYYCDGEGNVYYIHNRKLK